jgi:hypothetical protein
VAVSDGLVVMGGVDANGAPTRTVWKNGLDATGKAKPWADQAPLVEPNADGLAVHVGEWIYLIGGTNGTAKAVASVQLGDVGKNAEATDPNAIKDPWKVSAQTNLPVNRTNLAGFTTNGVVYLQGGSDGNAPTADTYWTTPSADGVISTWQTLPQTNLGAGLQGASAVVNGPYAFLIGGAIDTGPTNVPARAYLAPQTPFFQLGILGATVPGLALGGEVGQQIGYMNAAMVGTADFILLILIAIALNHRETVAQTIHRLRERRRRRKAEKAAAA